MWLCVLNQMPPVGEAGKPQARGQAYPLHREGKTLGPTSPPSRSPGGQGPLSG